MLQGEPDLKSAVLRCQTFPVDLWSEVGRENDWGLAAVDQL
jgi:hypothetical protein